MRWRPLFLLSLGVFFSLTGCRATRQDLVESELRARDNDLRQIRAELERSEAYTQYLERELRNSQGALSSFRPDDPNAPPSARLKSITLGRQTGGFEEDGIPGDEALQVVLETRDFDNHVVKIGGSAHVTVFEISPEGTKRSLCAWQVSSEEIRRKWQNGLLATGYFLVLPWKNWPTNEKLRVVVQFIGEDSRLYEADRDVTVRIVPALYRKSAPEASAPVVPLPMGESMPPAHEPELLPLPRKENVKPATPEKSAEPEKKPATGDQPPTPPGPVNSGTQKSTSLYRSVELGKPIAPGPDE